MTTHAAYFIPCDVDVEVVLEEGETEVTAQSIRCPALGDACRPGSCLAARISPAQLRAELDFLPSASGTSRTPGGRGHEEAARLVERARRRSLGREAERLRRWWREVGSGP